MFRIRTYCSKPIPGKILTPQYALIANSGDVNPIIIEDWIGTRVGSIVSETTDNPIRARVTSSGSTAAMARKITGVTIGQDYRAQITFRGGNGTSFFLRCGTDVTLSTFDRNFTRTAGEAGLVQNLDFVGGSDPYYIGIVVTVSGAGQYTECDKTVSLFEI